MPTGGVVLSIEFVIFTIEPGIRLCNCAVPIFVSAASNPRPLGVPPHLRSYSILLLQKRVFGSNTLFLLSLYRLQWHFFVLGLLYRFLQFFPFPYDLLYIHIGPRC
jgi:hypothetical protein